MYCSYYGLRPSVCLPLAVSHKHTYTPLIYHSSASFYLFCFHSYISKVDVLKILVTANYKYIPSLDDILETSAVTRLRNQLLEAEHYQLAVEVRQ